MTYIFLTLYNTGHEGIQAIVKPVMEPMLGALALTIHPDGQIALLNDSAVGIYNEPRELFDYGAQFGFNTAGRGEQASGPWALPEAGYYGSVGADDSYVICDAGPLGPDYIPGHAHADMLSFEMSLKGHRVIVDSGIHDYECSGIRSYCRSTGAHNTVEIAGQDQAEMWGTFRVARRGYPENVQWKPKSRGFELSAGHNGYSRLPGCPRHVRTFVWQDGGVLRVMDRVTASHDVECRSYVHLHPDCRCERRGESEILVRYPAGCFLVGFYGSGKLECTEASYYPELYTSHANTVLVYIWTATPDGEETGYCIEPQR